MFAESGEVPERDIVFAFFDGEERGKLGSLHYMSIVDTPYMIKRYEPPVLMLNFDMVGRVRENKVNVFGVKTSPLLSNWLDKGVTNTDLKLNKKALSGFNSDHLAFQAYGSPVLHFFSGYHLDYHTPRDITETVNFEGVANIVKLGFQVASQAAYYPGALAQHVRPGHPFSILAAKKLDLTHLSGEER